MEIWGWITQNLFTFLSSLGIVAGLWFTAFSLRAETKTRRVANLLTVTANHREIWTEFLNNEKLARVNDASAETIKHPIPLGSRVYRRAQQAISNAMQPPAPLGRFHIKIIATFVAVRISKTVKRFTVQRLMHITDQVNQVDR